MFLRKKNDIRELDLPSLSEAKGRRRGVAKEWPQREPHPRFRCDVFVDHRRDIAKVVNANAFSRTPARYHSPRTSAPGEYGEGVWFKVPCADAMSDRRYRRLERIRVDRRAAEKMCSRSVDRAKTKKATVQKQKGGGGVVYVRGSANGGHTEGFQGIKGDS